MSQEATTSSDDELPEQASETLSGQSNFQIENPSVGQSHVFTRNSIELTKNTSDGQPQMISRETPESEKNKPGDFLSSRDFLRHRFQNLLCIFNFRVNLCEE